MVSYLYKKIAMNKCLPFLFVACSLICFRVEAQDTAKVKPKVPLEKFYIGNGLDGPLFSSAKIENTMPGANTSSYGMLRFTWFLNIGISFNFNFSRHFGALTGVDLKNIGYTVENSDASITKRRTYNLGVPVALKIGNMARNKGYVFFGGGAETPINYKEKNYIIRAEKTKFNEWFSTRNPSVMPYVFLGTVIYRGLSVKAQYYPNNFFNQNYRMPNGLQPYLNTNVNLYFLSLGAVMRYGKHQDIVQRRVSELKMM